MTALSFVWVHPYSQKQWLFNNVEFSCLIVSTVSIPLHYRTRLSRIFHIFNPFLLLINVHSLDLCHSFGLKN